MSDFIKVNFLPEKTIGGDIIECASSYVSIKNNIRLSSCNGLFYAWDIANDQARGEITREEYNRLCRELGVSESDCSHKNKNYSALAQTVCATKYRIVFWECEDCGYLEAEQPTREELGIENA